MMAVSLALAFSGFGVMSLGMDRHYAQALGSELQNGRKIALRLMGWFLLAMALLPAYGFYGMSVGVAVWVGELTVAALAVALLLSYRPAWLLRLSLAAIVFSLFFNGDGL